MGGASEELTDDVKASMLLRLHLCTAVREESQGGKSPGRPCSGLCGAELAHTHTPLPMTEMLTSRAVTDPCLNTESLTARQGAATAPY